MFPILIPKLEFCVFTVLSVEIARKNMLEKPQKV